MSRKVIHDLVLPLILKELDRMGAGIPSYAIPHDEVLEDFFDEQLSILFSVCGGRNHCQELEKAIKEAQRRDPEAFQQVIKCLLRKYINLKKKLLEAKLKKEKLKGPPDRFSEQRKRAKYIFGLYAGVVDDD